jgi:predicted DNA-binding transcriptional regulator YafY
MRAGRLVRLLLLLQNRGRMTSGQLAAELEVSVRTVLRDIEELSGAGVPVYSIRGPDGGFELIDGYRTGLVGFDRSGERRLARAVLRISPAGRRLAVVLGRLQPMRPRRRTPPDDRGWVEVTIRLDSLEAGVVDILSLGPEVEVLEPEALRARVAELSRATAGLYR